MKKYRMLHVYGSSFEHDTTCIVGNRLALESLREAISGALANRHAAFRAFACAVAGNVVAAVWYLRAARRVKRLETELRAEAETWEACRQAEAKALSVVCQEGAGKTVTTGDSVQMAIWVGRN